MSLQQSKLGLGISCSSIHNFDTKSHSPCPSWGTSLEFLAWWSRVIPIHGLPLPSCSKQRSQVSSTITDCERYSSEYDSNWARNSTAICFSNPPVQTSAVLLLPDLVFRCQLPCFSRILFSGVSYRASSGSCIQVSAIVLLPDLVFRYQLSYFLRILCTGVSYRDSSGSCVQVSVIALLPDIVFRYQLSYFLRILCSGISYRTSLVSCVQVSAIVLP
jgi:hypothetical protein